MSAGGYICLGTQGMALLSAQIHLEDATRCRTNYPAATMVARTNRLEGIPIVGKTTLYTFLHKDKMDLIIGAQQREAILTLTERKTGYAIIEKLPNGKNAKSLARVVNRSLAYFKRMGLLHSITTDNGSEFMAFRSIERALRIPVFFAKPYCSTDKPHVDLLNNLIRQYIPKGTSFKDIDDKQIRNIRRLLNNRPRKSLDFKSPNEILALLLSYRCT